MDSLNYLVHNWVFQAVVSAAISWIFNKLADPPDRGKEALDQTAIEAATLASASRRNSGGQVDARSSVTDEQMQAIIDEALRRQGREMRRSYRRPDDDKESQQFAMLMGFMALGVALFFVFTYGRLAADVVRYLVFFTGFSAVFSMMRGYHTGLFQGRSSAGKTAVLLLVCVLCYAAADLARANIDATVEEAARQGRRFRTVWDVFNHFHIEGATLILSQAGTLLFVFVVSVFSVLAQVSMRMEAYTVRHPGARNWRTWLFSVLERRSSFGVLTVMLVISTLSLAYAAGWVTDLMQIAANAQRH